MSQPLSRGAQRRRALAAGALVAIPAAALALVGPGGGIEAASAEHAKRPNVVVVYTDDQDIASMRVMSLVGRTIAREGVTFRRHVATLPHCCPSRATFLTGQYAHNHEVFSNRPPDGGWTKFDESRTLAVALQRGGYRTAYVGKYMNGYPPKADLPGPIPPGWSTWFALVDWAMFGWRANVDGVMRRFGRIGQYMTDILKRRSMRFIRSSSAGNRPFFLTVAPLAPHTEPRVNWRENPRSPPRHDGRFVDRPLPHTPAFNARPREKPSFARGRRSLTKRQQRRLTRLNANRLESLLSVDELVRDLVGELRRLGELGNTYLIFTSDNGFMLGEHRQVGKNRLYEPSIRIPFVIRGPGLPAGVRRPQLTANIDLAPTIHAATGVDPLIEPDGISLLPAARSAGVDADRDLLLQTAPSVRGSSMGLRTPRYMYAEHENQDGELELELYDLRFDPDQLENLAPLAHAEHPEADPGLVALRHELRTRMQQLRECAGNSAPRSCR